MDECFEKAPSIEDGSAEKSELVASYLSLAQVFAAKLYKNRCDEINEYADYYHYAVIGLIEAADKYNRESEVPFEAYAKFRIKGSILNGIQKSSEKNEQLAYRKRIKKERLSSIKERDESKEDDIQFSQLVDVAVEMAIAYMLEDAGVVATYNEDCSDDLYRAKEYSELATDLASAVGKLPERQRIIIHYHYYHGMKFSDIADILGITKGRASQLHKKSITMIKQYLNEVDQIDDYY